ncbi:hypothetical protein THAOC_19111, partial [Thalassiosira oceanica]
RVADADPVKARMLRGTEPAGGHAALRRDRGGTRGGDGEVPPGGGPGPARGRGGLRRRPRREVGQPQAGRGTQPGDRRRRAGLAGHPPPPPGPRRGRRDHGRERPDRAGPRVVLRKRGHATVPPGPRGGEGADRRGRRWGTHGALARGADGQREGRPDPPRGGCRPVRRGRRRHDAGGRGGEVRQDGGAGVSSFPRPRTGRRVGSTSGGGAGSTARLFGDEFRQAFHES